MTYMLKTSLFFIAEKYFMRLKKLNYEFYFLIIHIIFTENHEKKQSTTFKDRHNSQKRVTFYDFDTN